MNDRAIHDRLIRTGQAGRRLLRVLAARENRDASFAAVVTAVAWLGLFIPPLTGLARDWWRDSEAAHGLLLAPLALGIAWHKGLVTSRRPDAALGIVMLMGAVAMRVVGTVAGELFLVRSAVLASLAGLTIFYAGTAQLIRWWLPFGLMILSVPIPEVVLASITLPLQLIASKIGTTLLVARHVPAAVSGNIVRLPGQDLFVAEACSGLRSVTALLGMGLLIGASLVRLPFSRTVVVLMALPVAIALNGLRVFVTGFLVYFSGPGAAKGFLHATEGGLIFLFAVTTLAVFAWVCHRIERLLARHRTNLASNA